MTNPTLRTLPAERFIPLVGADGPTFASAMQAIVTWGTSRSFRETVMVASKFPLVDDLPAFLLVNQLIYRGAARPTDIADAIQTGRSNVSKIVRRLETAGLVERARDPRDDRAVVVVLTVAGREVAQRILESGFSGLYRATADWSERDLAELERLIVNFARSLDALPDHPLAQLAGVSFSDD